MTSPEERPVGVVATDFSPLARCAADRAAALAQRQRRGIHLVHVFDSQSLALAGDWFGWSGSERQRLLDASQEQLQAEAARLTAERALAVSTEWLEGDVVTQILAAVQRCNAPWLMLGAHASAPMSRWLLGTIADRLLRFSSVPVGVIRQEPEAHGEWRHALIAQDFSASSRLALALVHEWMPQIRTTLFHGFTVPLEAKLHLAGVGHDVIHDRRERERRLARAELEQQALAAGWSPGTFDRVVLEGDAGPGIVRLSSDRHADLIVLGRQGRSRLAELLLGSVTQYVLTHARADVLVSTRVAS